GAGAADPPLLEEDVDRLAGLRLGPADDHPLPRRQTVGLQHDGKGIPGDGLRGLLPAADDRVGGGRDAGHGHQLLGVELRALQPGGLGTRAKRSDALGLQPVDQPGDQRGLRSDHHEVDVLVTGPSDQAVDVVGVDVETAGLRCDPGVAGGAEHLRTPGGARESAHDGVLAPTSADDENPQSDFAKSSVGIAASVWLLIVPREPSSTETLAMVLSSGASMIVMKSYWPSVAHCSLTLTPSCSTSLLTSWTREGLFFNVSTPSEVRLVSITYVGMSAPLVVTCTGSPPFLSLSAAACNPAQTPVRLSGDHPDVTEHPIFARFYDRLLAGTERAGLEEMRHELLASASGKVLELGAGTGLNLEHYTDAVTELVLTEPDPHMARRLRQRLAALSGPARSATVVEAPAENLPFDDHSFDTVVSTLVLCSVGDQHRALTEARRVLVEGG